MLVHVFLVNHCHCGEEVSQEENHVRAAAHRHLKSKRSGIIPRILSSQQPHQEIKHVLYLNDIFQMERKDENIVSTLNLCLLKVLGNSVNGII